MDVSKSPRLILVVAAYYPDSFGGAERQAKILADALGRQGVDVTLVAPSISRTVAPVEATSFGRVMRLHVKDYPNLGGRKFPSFLRWTMFFFRRFARPEYKDIPIYIFHARLHALGPALVATYLGSPLLLKLGGGGESSDFIALDEKRYLYGRLVKRFLLRCVDRFVANGAQIEQDLAALGVANDKIISFPNGVELPDSIAVDEAMAGRGGSKFVFAGRIIRDKNVALIVDAAEILVRHQKEFSLEFVGDGPELAALKKRTEIANLEARVAFSGFASDVYPSFMRSDFFVSASLREGQSNALLEAMSAGCIPIVFKASGVEDLVVNGVTGFIVSDTSAMGLADMMATALGMPPERRRQMAKAARQHVESSASVDAVATKTISLMDSVSLERHDRHALGLLTVRG